MMTNLRWAAVGLLLTGVAGLELYLLTSGAEESPTEEMGGDSVRSPRELPRLPAGERVPAFEVERLDGEGERVRVDFEGTTGRTFLFAFAPTDGTCLATIPFWNEIAGRLAAEDRVFGLSIDIGGNYHFQGERSVVEKELRFPAFRFVRSADRERYRIENVPHTIVIGPDGTVDLAIVGRLSDGLVERIVSADDPAKRETE